MGVNVPHAMAAVVEPNQRLQTLSGRRGRRAVLLHQGGAPSEQNTSMARKSLTLVKVGPGTTRSPSGAKKP
jgi:hypothetical protein